MEKIFLKPVILSLLCVIVICSIISASALGTTVTRSVPLTAKKGSFVQINLTVDVNESDFPVVLGIQENISTGVTIISTSSGVSGLNSMEWILLTNSSLRYTNVTSQGVTAIKQLQDQNLSYMISIPTTYSSSNVTLAGGAFSTIDSTISGPTSIPVSGLAGDANTDNYVNVIDLQRLARSFDKNLGEDGFDASCDFNNDNAVNVIDLQILTRNFFWD